MSNGRKIAELQPRTFLMLVARSSSLEFLGKLGPGQLSPGAKLSGAQFFGAQLTEANVNSINLFCPLGLVLALFE